ncbi:MAG: hypothetical protein FJX57_16305, partial [Alphaproteobacteria bacterium]|nr:hypothetical protein [Alphaproteobacteria bacterium]
MTLASIARSAAALWLLATAFASPPPAAAQTSANFEVVRRHLDLGGPLFVFMDVDGEGARIGRELAAAVAKVAGDDPDMALFRQDYAAILADLGLSQIKAVGMSSIARREGGFHNRAFIQVSERRGLLAAFGGPARPFTTTRLAPADTDFFVETELDMPALVSALTTIAGRFIPGATPEMAGQIIEGNGGEDAATAFRVVTSMKGRITLLLRLGETTIPDPKHIEEWGFGFAQKAQLLLRVEGIGRGVMPMVEKIDELTSETVGALRIYRARESVPFLGDNQPVLAIDGDTVLLATSRAFLQQSLTRTAGLAEAPAFRGALAAVGLEEGNTLAYGTPRFFSLLRALLGAAGDLVPKKGDTEFLGPLLQVLIGQIPDLDESLAQVTANVPEGIAMRANSVVSMRSALLALGIYNPDLIGPILLAAVPAAVQMQVEKKAQSRAVENTEANLVVIAEAALAFFRENPGATEV